MTRPTNPTRRQFLRHSADLALLTGLAGVLATSKAAANPAADSGMKSIQKMEGKVFVNGRAAKPDTYISSNAEVRTGPRSTVAFTAGGDVHLLKSNASVKLAGDSSFVSNVRVLSGTLMSVWGTRPEGKETQLQTATATMGIRGTITVASKDSFTVLEGKVLYKWTDSKGVQHTDALESDGTKLVSIDKNGQRSNQMPPGITAEDIGALVAVTSYLAEVGNSGATAGVKLDPGTLAVLEIIAKSDSFSYNSGERTADQFINDFNTEFNNATGGGSDISPP